MPIDEIVFAVSCSATGDRRIWIAVDEKRVTKYEIEWQCLKIDRPKTKLNRAIRTFQKCPDEMENTFF